MSNCKVRFVCCIIWASVAAGQSLSLQATDIVVNNESGFSAALGSATDGDRILLAPGTYNGGFFQSGLTGVTIRSQFVANPAIIQGGVNAIQLSDATRVTLEYLILEGQTGNGLNIDDGGSFVTPSTGITLRDLVVRDMNASGNNDGIKLSGVTGFLIERVHVSNWGNGGSAIDPVGCHNGLIQNSWFQHDAIGVSGSGIRPKGGCKNITIRANRFEFNGPNGRVIQAGGSTGAAFFRYIDGDSGYEADEIFAEGNVVINGSASFAFVNIDGGHFHHNLAWRPDDWLLRILNENPGTSIVDTRNGILSDNVMVFNDTASEFNQAVNIGPETEPATFTFLMNQWYNQANPSASVPNLPATEVGGIYGVAPTFGVDDAIGWQFPWGIWVVNANPLSSLYPLTDPAEWLVATPGSGATFQPLRSDPFVGPWTFQQAGSTALSLPAWSQRFLVPSAVRATLKGQKLLDGLVSGGSLVDVLESDDLYLQLDPSPTSNPLKQKVDVIHQGVATNLNPAALTVRIEAKINGGPMGDVMQRIQLFNVTANLWETVDDRPAPVADQSIVIQPAGDLSRFVQPLTGEVTSRVTWTVDEFSGKPFQWNVDLDEVAWLLFD